MAFRSFRVGVQRARVEDGGVAGQQPDRGRVDDAVGVPVDHQRGPGGLGADDRARIGDGVRDQGRRPSLVGWPGQGGLVEVGGQRHVGAGSAVGDRVGQPCRGGGQVLGHLLGIGDVVALIGLVVLDQHVPGAHQGRHRGQGVPVHGAVLEGRVHRLEDIGRGQRAHDLLLVGHEGPGHETRIDRVDGVPPAVGGEIVAGQGVHPRRRVGLVEGGGGLADVEGRRRRLGEAVGDDGPGPQGHGGTGHGGHRERPDDEPGLAHPGGHGADPGAEEHGQTEDDQWRGPVGRAQSQPGRGVHQERLDGRAHLRRIGIGVGADGQHHAHHGDQHEVGPVPPP